MRKPPHMHPGNPAVKAKRRLPKIRLNPPSKRTLAEEEAIARASWANRREAKGHDELFNASGTGHPEGGGRLMVLPRRDGGGE